MNCPDHPRALVSSPDGSATCPFCKGALWEEAQVDARCPGAARELSMETREDCGAFARVRACPSCGVPMTPWRIMKLEAWLEKCPSCQRFWADRQDQRILEGQAKRKARKEAVASFTPAERRELAAGLAESVAPPEPTADLSPLQLALMFVGVPSVTRLSGNKVPWATWALAAAIFGVFLLGKAAPGAFGAEALAYDPLTGAGLFTATFAHFGWLHVVGNVGFLLAFGDGVEQRVPRWALVAGFLGLSPLFTWLEAVIGEQGALIGGASGGVALITGACVFLQPKAKVWFLLFGRLPLHVPILAFGGFFFVTQGLMAAIGVGGVAWWAHLTGLVTGVALGLGLRWARLNVSSAAPA